MPVILIKNQTFEENETHSYVNVPIKGITKKDLSIFVTDTYLKVSLFIN